MNIDTNAIYVRAMAAAIIPFIVILGFFGVMIVSLYFFKKPYKTTNFLICYVVINIFLQPTVLKELTNVLNCIEFEYGVKVVRVQREIDCKSKLHEEWVNKNKRKTKIYKRVNFYFFILFLNKIFRLTSSYTLCWCIGYFYIQFTV